MKLTRDLIFAHRTDAGSWTRGQVEALGVKWPPLHGWLAQLIDTEISEENFAEFVRCRTVTGKQLRGEKRRNVRTTRNMPSMADRIMNLEQRMAEIERLLVV